MVQRRHSDTLTQRPNVHSDTLTTRPGGIRKPRKLPEQETRPRSECPLVPPFLQVSRTRPNDASVLFKRMHVSNFAVRMSESEPLVADHDRSKFAPKPRLATHGRNHALHGTEPSVPRDQRRRHPCTELGS